MIFGNTIYNFYTIYKRLGGMSRPVPVPALGWDGTILSWDGTGRDIPRDQSLWDGTRLSRDGMGRDIPWDQLLWDGTRKFFTGWDGTKSPWDGISRPIPWHGTGPGWDQTPVGRDVPSQSRGQPINPNDQLKY